MIKHIQLPENVFYALENRAPYYFYLEDADGQYSKRIEFFFTRYAFRS